MQSILFLIILFISTTLIYLAVCKKTIQINIENFENKEMINSINNISIETIAMQLKISPTRIKNYKENGSVDNIDNYSIEFEIQPRNILQLKLNEPTLDECQQKLLQMTKTNETFNLKSLTGKDLFLSKILINSTESNKIIDENQKRKEDLMKNKDKFIDPQLKKSVKYLKDTEKGFPNDYDLDPRYYFDKGNLVLEEDPSITPTPEPTLEPTLEPILEPIKENFSSKKLTEVREFFI